MSIPRQSAVWDESRNSSQTRPPAANALRDALTALSALRRNDPDLVKWVEDGHPLLSEEEHVARFGHAYHRTRR